MRDNSQLEDLRLNCLESMGETPHPPLVPKVANLSPVDHATRIQCNFSLEPKTEKGHDGHQKMDCKMRSCQ